MAMVTYPLNNINYNASDAELYNCTRNSGIYSEDDFRPQVSGGDNYVTVGPGIGWIRNSKFSGKVVALKSPQRVDLGVPDASLPRMDAVCIRFSKNGNKTEIAVKKGTPSSQPKTPTITQTETVYELYICKVYRAAGAVSIVPSTMTDLRLDPAVCGLMADAVTSVDTGAISAQINALIKDLQKEIAAVRDASAYMLKRVYDPQGYNRDAFRNASSVAIGMVKLSDSVDSGLNTEGVTAATPKAVNTVNQKFGNVERIVVVSKLPSSPEANVLYLVTG